MFTQEDNLVLDNILNARWTCRSFKEEVPLKEDIEAIIHAGEIAPYASLASRDVVPFRHFFVMFRGDPRFPVIDRLIREQSAADLQRVRKEAETDAFLQEYLPGLEKLWGNAAQNGLRVFPNPPCLIIAAEWQGSRRAHRQSLAHMMQNMWIKTTALNLDFALLSVIESMAENEEFCSLFDLPVKRYGFLGCVIGYRGEITRTSHPATSQIHWL